MICYCEQWTRWAAWANATLLHPASTWQRTGDPHLGSHTYPKSHWPTTLYLLVLGRSPASFIRANPRPQRAMSATNMEDVTTIISSGSTSSQNKSASTIIDAVTLQARAQANKVLLEPVPASYAVTSTALIKEQTYDLVLITGHGESAVYTGPEMADARWGWASC